MTLSSMLTIGQLAQRTGISISAIRYYESQGIISPGRNAGGHRRFHRTDLRRLSFVLISQQFGFTIAEIRSRLEILPEGRTPNKKDWKKISIEFRTELEKRLKILTNLRDKLDGCIGCGCLSLDKCKLYNPEDKARAYGSGPRFLLGDRPLD